MLQIKENPLTFVGAEHGPAEEPFAWVPSVIEFIGRARRTIIVSMMVCVALAILYLVLVTPKFDATTQVLIDLRQSELFRQQSSPTDSQVLNSLVESQVEILRSDATALAAVNALGAATVEAELAQEGSILSPGNLIALLVSPDAPKDARQVRLALAERLMKMTTVRRVGITNLIEITVRSTSPDRSARLADALADAFIAGQLEAKYETTRRGGIWLQTRLQELREQATAADRAVQKFKADRNIIDTDKGLMSERQVGDLNANLIVAQSKTAEAKARYDRINDILKSDVRDGAVAEVAQNPVIVRLRQQYLDTAKREADIASKYGSSHIAAVNARAEMAEIERSLRGELTRIAEIYKSDYEVARAGETALKRQLDRLIAEAGTNNQARVELRSLESSSQTYRALYENFLQKYTQAVQDQSFPISEARVVAAAQPPLRKSAPKSTLILLAAIVASLAVGMVLSFIGELIRRGVRSVTAVEQVTGLPCIAMIPTVGQRRTRWQRLADLVGVTNVTPARAVMRDSVARPHAATADEMHRIKFTLDRRVLKDGACSVIGIVSAISGEGKTTLASNLAHYLARSGRRALLLDWDLRHPLLSRSLVPEAEVGLIEALSKATTSGLQALEAGGGHLHILPTVVTGHVEHTAELLTGGVNQQLMAVFRKQYDVIIVDLPPMADFIDTRAADNMIDAYLLVVRYDYADRNVIRDCLAQDKFDAKRAIGAVLNRVSRRQHEMRASRISRYLPWRDSYSSRYAIGGDTGA
ncbi:AAA family ATPase [Methylobacterium currus]|uniref:nucleotide-binding protein n=1 Tax=Methylobacterium currus TaxID=2051553 RepID=UPI001E50C13E|nr:AAA family ATPase [Methylobacterium currus]UHC16680.1 AAA family ATPase [Methylobacterium currus]